MINTINERSKQTLAAILHSLNYQTFDEDSIIELLRNLRPFFREKQIIFEIANFLAHPEGRNEGICHKALDHNYAKLKFVHANDGTIKINPAKIEITLFQVLILASVEDYPVKELFAKLNTNQERLIHKIKSAYKKEKGYYNLINAKALPEFLRIFQTIISVLRSSLVFENNLIIDELKSALEEVNNQFKLDYNIESLMQKIRDDLLVCIMCLLHSSIFGLFDGSTGHCYLSIALDTEALKRNERKWVLILLGEVAINDSLFNFPIMKLDVDAARYVQTNGIMIDTFSVKLPFFNAVRDKQNKLVIARKSY